MADTLVSALRRAVELDRPDGGLRFIDRREKATWYPWSDVLQRVTRVAGALAELGVVAGDRVGIILPTGVSFTDAFFGVQFLGAVPVPLYPPVRLGRLDEYFTKTAHMLQGAQVRLILTEPRIRRLLGKVTSTYLPELGMVDASSLLEGSPHPGHDVSPDDLGLVQFSSGTTVAPKAVGLTHRQLLANASRILDVIFEVSPRGSQDEAAGVSWLPLYHDMGLIGGIFPAILAPGPITLIPPEVFLAKPGIWLRTLSTFRGTISPAPNFAYAMCVERVTDEELEGVDLSAWAMALNGAEPISASTIRAFQERFAPYGFRETAPMPVYGLSEAALAVTFSDAHAPFRAERFRADALGQGRAEPDPDGVELVSSGAPLPDFAVRITGPDGPLPEGEIGQILAKGPSLMQGYLDRDTQPFDEDGWLVTGDLGFLSQGELFVTGRAKDLIILRGRNHAPHDIERAADGVEGIRRGCAAAVAEVGEHGERLLVFVEVRTPAEGQAEAIERAIRSQIGISADLVALLEPGTLPRTSSGKIRRAETLRRWQQGELAPPDSVTPWMLAGVFARSAMASWRTRWSRD